MKIPILDLTPEIQALWPEFQKAIEGVFQSTQFILGPNVHAFEKEMADYLGVKHAIGCNSGTDALIIALRALGVGPGDEVITTPFTFFATGEVVNLVGATPVFVDIAPETFNIDVNQIAAKITTKTRAIIPVHLFGNSADMRPLQTLAAQHGLPVLEDVAQALGGEYEGRKLGSLGEMGAFSFFPSKNLGAFGDAGLVTTNDDKLAELCRKLRVHGSIQRYRNEMIGYNSRMDELQAALLRIKLKRLDEANEGRRLVARRYNEVFKGIPGVVTPNDAPHSKHVYHQYTLRVPASKRDVLHEKLAEQGIGSMIYYPIPLHQLPVYQAMKWGPFPIAEKAAEEVISLPIWPTLSSEAQLEVAGAVQAILQ